MLRSLMFIKPTSNHEIIDVRYEYLNIVYVPYNSSIITSPGTVFQLKCGFIKTIIINGTLFTFQCIMISYYSMFYLVINSNLPSVSFSPESGGKVKPSSAIEDMRTQGTIRLKK